LIAIRLLAAVVFSTTTLAGRPDLAAFFVPHDAHSGMTEHSLHGVLWINMRAAHVPLPWKP
jgi:hypothetical protein